jgi:hypothetical protein
MPTADRLFVRQTAFKIAAPSENVVLAIVTGACRFATRSSDNDDGDWGAS